MHENIRAVFLITLFFAGQQGLLAQSNAVQMQWDELAPMIAGHRVALDLTEGVTVKGEVVAVRENTLLLDVSSAVRGYAKGNGSIPRGSVDLINLERTRGSWGRIMGTVIGVIGGLVIGGYVTTMSTSNAGPGIATFIGVTSGISIGGYYAGRKLDKRVTHIRIVP